MPRVELATVIALLAFVIGLLEMFGRRVPLVQWDRETEQRWMSRGAWTSAALNGLTLGSAFTSRLGYWLWYAIPIGAFLYGHALVGAATYGLYGLVRGGVPVMLAGLLTRPKWEERTSDLRTIQTTLVSRARIARRTANWELAATAVAVLVAVGR